MSSKNEIDMQTIDAMLRSTGPVESSVSALKQVVFVVLGVLVTAAPIRLYLSGLFDLSMEDHLPHFVIVTAAATVLLVRAYSHTAQLKEKSLVESYRELLVARKMSNKGKKAKQQAVDDEHSLLERVTKVSSREAAAYALFINNFAFTFFYLAIAFVFLPPFLNRDSSALVDDHFFVQKSLTNYIISIISSALLTSFLNL